MGVDLALSPIDNACATMASLGFLCFNRLDTDRDYRLQDAVRAIAKTDGTNGQIWGTYQDDGLDRSGEDAYGEPLMSLPAVKLLAARHDDMSEWNRAVWAFLEAMPPETPVVLYWH